MKIQVRATLRLSLLFLALCAPALHAETPLPSGVIRSASAEGITEYRLKNGLQVVLFPDASKPSVVVNLVYKVGSKHENYGETGMAHLLEHLLFKGTPTIPNLDQEFQSRGMRTNATTNTDATNYFELFTASDENLRWAIAMEADRMVNANVAKQDLDSEMTVVRNEFERGENDAGGVLFRGVHAAAYRFHAYGKPTIGARSDVENVSVERLQAFYRTYYQPDNAVLVIAGQFDEGKVLGWIAESFGKIPKPSRALPPLYTEEPAQDGEREVTVRRVGENQLLMALYHTPAATHTDNAALAVLGNVLADRPNGRMHKALVESKLAAAVWAGNTSRPDRGNFMAGVEFAKDMAAAELRSKFLGALEQISATPVTDAEVARAKTLLLNQREQMMNQPEAIGLSLTRAVANGDWRLFFLERDLIKAVTAADVNRVAAKYLVSPNRTLGAFVPTPTPMRVEVPAAPTVATALQSYKPAAAVAAGEAFDPTPAKLDARAIRKQLLPGVQLGMLAKKNRGETVTVQIQFDWGSEQELFGRGAAAELVGDMLLRGSRQHTKEEIKNLLAGWKASRLGVSGTDEYGLVRITTVREHLPAVLKLTRSVLREPAFNPEEFETLKQNTLVDLENNRTDPGFLATEAVSKHLNRYPEGHVLAFVPRARQIELLRKLDLAAVKKFYEDFWGASNAYVSIVGDFDPATTEAQLRDMLSGWTSRRPFTRVTRLHSEIPATQINIEAADKANAWYVARTHLSLNWNDADYPALWAANQLLGASGMESRLVKRLRGKDGLTYGAYSSLSAGSYFNDGRLAVLASFAPANRDRLEKALQEEFSRALEQGFSADELQSLQRGYLASSKAERAQDAYIGGHLILQLRHGFTFQRLADWDSKIAALTPADVNAALKRHFDPGKLTVAVAGDFAKATKVAADQPAAAATAAGTSAAGALVGGARP